MATFYPINTPLVNYFFYKAPLTTNGPNVPLSGGFIFSFADADHTIQLPTYSDVSDPNNLIVNPYPLPLGLAGDWPFFYILDQPYYFVITGPDMDLQNPIWTLPPYNPGAVADEEAAALNTSILVNGQFSFPWLFWPLNATEGQITEQQTPVAWAWNFLQDDPALANNVVTFTNLANENFSNF